MEDIFWTEQNLTKQLQQKKILDNEQYKDYKLKDYLVECLDNEIIYNYDCLDRNLFKHCFCLHKILVVDLSQNRHYETYEILEKDLEKFSESFKSREVRIKVMYYIHENVENIWDNIKSDSIQDYCARIINKNIIEVENEDYQGMPRPDFKKLIFGPNFFKEKTPSRRWREEQIKNVEDAIQTINTPVQEEAEEHMIVEQPIKEEKQEETVFGHAETSILPEKSEKFRYIISNDPQEVETTEKNIAIYVKNNQPTELCKYLFNNENKLFHKMPVKSVSIYHEIERIWGKENKIKLPSLNQAWNRIRKKRKNPN